MQNKTKTEPSAPNMILVGHHSQPTYALGWSNVSPIVASGSRDGSILVWNLKDHINASQGFTGQMPENNEEEGRKSKNAKINGAKSSVPVSAKKATPKEEQDASSD